MYINRRQQTAEQVHNEKPTTHEQQPQSKKKANVKKKNLFDSEEDSNEEKDHVTPLPNPFDPDEETELRKQKQSDDG